MQSPTHPHEIKVRLEMGDVERAGVPPEEPGMLRARSSYRSD